MDIKSLDFLLEIYTEEICASYQELAIGHWKRELHKELANHLLDYANIQVYATHKRIGIYIANLANKQRDTEKELKGPKKEICFKNKKPTSILQKFIEKNNTFLAKIYFREITKGEYAFTKSYQVGRDLPDILPDILEKIITKTNFPKKMRWQDLAIEYARPILYYFAIYGSQNMKFSQNKFFQKLSFSHQVYKNFFLQKENQIKINNVKDYVSTLEKNQILVDSTKRMEYILKLLKKAAQENQLELLQNTNLLKEVNFLVETPFVVQCSFDKQFLGLPDKLILSEMNQHQKYFGTREKDGKLSNVFFVVANGIENKQNSIQKIQKGNERVLQARLYDAKFFVEEDSKISLKERSKKLSKIVYQEKLGSMHHKQKRIQKIAHYCNTMIFKDTVNSQQIDILTNIMKADLSCQLVFEFDHLQGYIGSYYAKKEGYNNTIADAIYEQYLPRFYDDAEIPKSNLGIIASVADKMDNLISAAMLDKLPQAKKDPLSIRRQTLCIIKIILVHKLSFHFYDLLEKLMPLYVGNSNVVKTIWNFIQNRIETVFLDRGFSKNFIRAGLGVQSYNVYEIYSLLSALLQIEKDQTFQELTYSFNRMYSILQKTHPDISVFQNAKVQPKLFILEEERKLYQWSCKLVENIQSPKKDYNNLFQFFILGKNIIDCFFDNVLVHHEDPKIQNNRIQVLGYVIYHILQVIDIRKL